MSSLIDTKIVSGDTIIIPRNDQFKTVEFKFTGFTETQVSTFLASVENLHPSSIQRTALRMHYELCRSQSPVG